MPEPVSEDLPVREFSFDMGNSNIGAIGYVAYVKAPTPEEAARMLRAALPQDNEVPPFNGDLDVTIYVFFNEEAVSEKDADDADAGAEPAKDASVRKSAAEEIAALIACGLSNDEIVRELTYVGTDTHVRIGRLVTTSDLVDVIRDLLGSKV